MRLLAILSYTSSTKGIDDLEDKEADVMVKKWYEHFVTKKKGVLENDEMEILWDVTMQTEMRIDIVLIKKKILRVPVNTRIKEKEKEKMGRYTQV